MKRTLLFAATVLALTGCQSWHDYRASQTNPYTKPPFYAKYLDTGSALDARITEALDAVQKNPSSAPLHNDLGALLIEKGFPKDAQVEFRRAIAADGHYYQAWYNLGLVRAGMDDERGAAAAFRQTVDLKPGHAAALFQLGLIEEGRHHLDRAVALYAKAYRINPALLDVEVNPRILDSGLTDLALLAAYNREHARQSMQLQDAPVVREMLPPVSSTPPAQDAPSRQPVPQQIVPPAAPVTDPSMRPVIGSGSAASSSSTSSRRSRRPRKVEIPEPVPEPAPPPEPVEDQPTFDTPPVPQDYSTPEPPVEQESQENQESQEEPPPPPPPGPGV